MNMTITIKNQRKDDKFTVGYSFSNGVHLTKIRDAGQLNEEIRKLGPKYAALDTIPLSAGAQYTRHYE
jgi:hypothetical protein